MSESGKKIRVLFVCTGNACRSQMAEGWARHLKSDIIKVSSAGVNPVGVSSRAIEAMAEAGVDISSHVSRHIDEYFDVEFDYVVAMSRDAKKQCRGFGGNAKLVYRAFSDPIMALGTREQTMVAFRKARDKIKAYVETLPESLGVDVPVCNNGS